MAEAVVGGVAGQVGVNGFNRCLKGSQQVLN